MSVDNLHPQAQGRLRVGQGQGRESAESFDNKLTSARANDSPCLL